MNRKELTKTFIMISKYKSPLVSIFIKKIAQRFKDYRFKRQKIFYQLFYQHYYYACSNIPGKILWKLEIM